MPTSNPKTRVLCVFGTRPDAVKMAPVVLELQKYAEDFDVSVVVTGQHREQLDQVLRVFGITPDHDLAIMQHGQTLVQITTRALEGLDAWLRDHPADLCLAQGDTTTTFVAALAAFYHKVPFGHVEAGLRTGNPYDPFPEEMNRRLAGVLTRWHFAPTEPSRDNLLAEGIAPETIYVTGNTSIDALRSVAAQSYRFDDPELRAVVESDRRLILVTAHRRENWGEPMANIARALARLAGEFSDSEIVVPQHKNPIVRDTLRPILADLPRVHLVEPQEYVPFVKLMQRAGLILTDSGGVQEEAPTLGVPILVLRQTTERPEGVTAGTAKLIGTDEETIVTEARRLLTDPAAHAEMARNVNPYGDGNAAERIVGVLRNERP
jgi:UDP-N-acetylglucosamine 2-epimerase (non-hydrolysing)